MPRPNRDHNDWDEGEERSGQQNGNGSMGGTILAAAGFGLTLIIGGVIGFAAGRPAKEPEKAKPVEVAQQTPPVVMQHTPPVVVPPEPEKPPTPEPKKPEVKEPEAKNPEPKKPIDPPKKPVAPPKKVVPPKRPENPPQATTAVAFQKDVLPIFKGKCNSCHGDAGNPKGDLDLRTLATALRGGDNGPGAKPGKLEDSQIWKSIDDGTMPPPGKEKLTAAELKTVRDWILAGAK